MAKLFIDEIFIYEAGIVTVTKVTITSDLKLAKIYLSFLENKNSIDNVISIIKEKSSLFKLHIGKTLSLKFIPELRFYYDDSIKYAEHIDQIFKKINND